MIHVDVNSAFSQSTRPFAYDVAIPTFESSSTSNSGSTRMSSSVERILVVEPTRQWRSGVVAQLEKLVKLPFGWDGYRGRPVSFETANFALRMLESTCDTGAPEPQIVPGSSGDLQIEWHSSEAHIELHVRAPNDVHCWRATVDTGQEGEDIPLTINFKVVSTWVRQLSESVRGVATAA